MKPGLFPCLISFIHSMRTPSVQKYKIPWWYWRFRAFRGIFHLQQFEIKSWELNSPLNSSCAVNSVFVTFQVLLDFGCFWRRAKFHILSATGEEILWNYDKRWVGRKSREGTSTRRCVSAEVTCGTCCGTVFCTTGRGECKHALKSPVGGCCVFKNLPGRCTWARVF